MLFKYIFGVSVFDHAFIEKNGLPETIKSMQKKYRFYRPAMARFLINFFKYLVQLESNLPHYNKQPVFILHCCCWGDAYADKMVNYYIPSLLAENNLPAVARSMHTTILLHCDQDTKDLIENSGTALALRQHAELNYIVVPDEFLFPERLKQNLIERYFLHKLNLLENCKYYLLGGFQTHAFKVAQKNKAMISFMMPDVVLSDSFLMEAMQQIQGKKMLVNTTFRTNFNAARPQLNKFKDAMQPARLTISSPALTELQIDCIHASAKRRVVSEDTVNFYASAQLIFNTRHGYIIRAFHYHPVMIDCSRLNTEIRMDYYPIDNSILNSIVDYDSALDTQVEISTDRNKLAWIELSEDDIEQDYALKRTNTYEQLLDKVASMISHQPDTYFTPLNHFFVSARNEVFSSKVDNEQVNLDDYKFIDDVYTQVKERLSNDTLAAEA